jgi:tRNA threonylcarbamoyladenosine biosynthesis protein TsaB
MKVLGIDTSGYANAIGVVDGAKVLADRVFEAKSDSLEKIVANIDSVLKEARLNLEDVQGIGVGLGPGSWTGIRVGVTVGKMLAFSTDKPIAGVPTLEALAFNARDAQSPICAIIDAGAGGAVYAGLYRPEDRKMIRLGDYYVGDVRGLGVMLERHTVLVGARASAYRQEFSEVLGFIDLEARDEVPHGAALALLAEHRLEQSEDDDVLALAPLYLKEWTAKALSIKTSS